VNFSLSRKLICKTSNRDKKGETARLTISAFIVLAIVFSAACGRHKAHIKTPPSPKPAAPAIKTESRQTPLPQSQPSTPQPAVKADTFENVSPPLPAPAADASSGPLIRIGLTTDAKEIRISSTADFYFLEKKAEASRQLVQGEIQVRVEQAADENSSVYRVQAASFTKQDLALKLKKQLFERFSQPAVIRGNEDSGLYQVQVGEFPAKEEAQTFLKSVIKAGYSDAFIVKETVPVENAKTTLALRGPEKLFRLSEAGFLFQPSSRNSFLRVDGKPYRGVFEISLNKNGRMTVVNQVGTEEYLLSVVPAEMSPSSYPEFAGLAALSIAARTYALFWKNNDGGKYHAQGFDLSDDTSAQVYAGVAAEKEATSEAVRQTSGLAVYYQDKLIDAMYMSTCGGRTENFSNVFDSYPVPYLTSVFCAIENGPDKGETVLQGKHDLEQLFQADDGSLANRNIEFARALGIIEVGPEMTPDFLGQPPERTEIIRWVERAGKIAQKAQSGIPAATPDLQTRSGFLQYAAEAFFGAAEIKRKISPRDVEYYIGNFKDGASVPDSARVALSYLIQGGLWRPFGDNTVRPNGPVRRGDALFLLLRWIESVRPEILRKGTFVSAGLLKGEIGSGSAINVKWGNRTQEFKFSQNPYLFRLDPGRTTPVSDLRIIGNEKLYFHVNAQGVIDFLEIELNPAGASSDRYSPLASWDTTLSRSAVAEKLRGLAGSIGDFRDLKPYKIGDSGRAVQIQIIGSRSSVVLNGYKVRNALNLRDTLFTLTREYSPDGSIASFTFHGRGFGHGVGLCQVGAFGMARSGRSYEDIIKTYYQGVQIRKAY
jgi:stage II sporulation protein D